MRNRARNRKQQEKESGGYRSCMRDLLILDTTMAAWIMQEEMPTVELNDFRLDGVVYCAIEDPQDGYRSCMRDLVISDTAMTNVFMAVRVTGSMVGEALELRDISNGRVVLEVGTHDCDDYYPSYVANWWPDRLGINDPECRLDHDGRV